MDKRFQRGLNNIAPVTVIIYVYKYSYFFTMHCEAPTLFSLNGSNHPADQNKLYW